MVVNAKLNRLSKTEIADRFRACCQKLGETPGRIRFCRLAGVKQHQFDYYWPRFSDLVKEAGASPQDWQVRIPESELFEEYAKVCLHLGKIPTSKELRIATRQLQTRTHVVAHSAGGSLAEFDRRFRCWLEAQSDDLRKILEFPGWKRGTTLIKERNAPPTCISPDSFPTSPLSSRLLARFGNPC